LKPPEIPNLANKTNKGIKTLESVPRNRMKIPPTTEIDSKIV